VRGRVLIIAGSDSSGGAGIQADIKAVTALGAYAATAITALTAQNTTGVYGVHSIPEDFISQQIRLVLEDIGADAIKTGMLASEEVINTVAGALFEWAQDIPTVVDPVMVAKSGDMLLAPGAMDAMRRRLLPRAFILTPNRSEAESLAGVPVRDIDGLKRAAERLAGMGPRNVLVKGGHLEGAIVTDVLLTADGFEVFEKPRLDTRATHGTGCTLSSAIAALLAQGCEVREAVGRALAYVHDAIRAAPGYGHGAGPLNHCVYIP
jgi:hydroxymethylpyrimidine/phosphomethylpyrimidine kinase